MTTSRTDWVKEIEPTLIEVMGHGKWGGLPSFPIDLLNNYLQTFLQKKSLSVSVDLAEWRVSEHFYDGFNSSLVKIPLSITPLDGSAEWIMSENDIKTITNWLQGETEATAKAKHPEVIQGLYRYALLETIAHIHKQKVYDNLTPTMGEKMVEAETAYSLDIAISDGDQTLWGRLLISKPLQESFLKHFTLRRPTLANLTNLPDVKIPLSISTGSVELTTGELESLCEGDFLVVENSHYRLKEKKGTFQILLQNQPLFQVKKRDTGLKILDFIYFYEESAMDNEYFDEDEDISDDADLEMSEEMVDETPSDKQEPFFETEEKAEPGDARSFETPTIEKTSVAHIPITVHMELARINVSLAELKAMAPGEQLPIEINPRSVSLTVNGKAIGRGEVIELGGITGIKLLELYK